MCLQYGITISFAAYCFQRQQRLYGSGKTCSCNCRPRRSRQQPSGSRPALRNGQRAASPSAVAGLPPRSRERRSTPLLVPLLPPELPLNPAIPPEQCKSRLKPDSPIVRPTLPPEVCPCPRRGSFRKATGSRRSSSSRRMLPMSVSGTACWQPCSRARQLRRRFAQRPSTLAPAERIGL